MKSFDIIGAGTAGLSMANLLGGRGFDVNVYDKAPKIGSRYNESVQSIRNYSLDEDILEQFESHRLITASQIKNFYPVYNQIRFLGDIQHSYELSSSSKPAFYNFMRGIEDFHFDSMLYRNSQDKGVHFNLNTKYENKKESSICIDASGSQLTKEGISFIGKEFHLVTNDDVLPNTILIVYGHRSVKNGYIYVLPYKINDISHITIGFAKPLNQGQFESGIFQRFIDEGYLDYLSVNNYMIKGEKRIFAKAGFLEPYSVFGYKIGEGLGVLDPSLGFGNVEAIRSAIILSDFLERGKGTYFQHIIKMGVFREAVRNLSRRIFSDSHNILRLIDWKKLQSLGFKVRYEEYVCIKEEIYLKRPISKLVSFIISCVIISTSLFKNIIKKGLNKYA
jgi:flavin-dependent dehydrogenase